MKETLANRKIFLSFSLMILVIVNGNSLSATGWEPLDYKMNIRVDYQSGKIFADCELTLINNSEPSTKEIPILLYRLLNVTSVTDSKGNELPFVQIVKTMEGGNSTRQVNAVSIKLHKKVLSKQEYRVNITYEGTILGYAAEGFTYVKERIEEPYTILRPDALAFPLPALPNRLSESRQVFFSHNYYVTVTVPKHLAVANGGELVSIITENDMTSYTYRNIKPAWRMDFAIAPYSVVEKDGLKIFHFQDNKEGAERVMRVAKRCLELFTDWFGPLKDFKTLSIIQIAEGYGSQADVTSILQEGSILNDSTLNRLLYHEISHLWHTIETEPFPPCRWNEGLATFLEYYTAEKLDNRLGLLNRATTFFINLFNENCNNTTNCSNTALIDYGKQGLIRFSYTKGMVLFRVLYELIGHDSFMNLVSSYYNKYYLTGGSTHALTAMIKELPYEGLSRFVDEWFYAVESNEYLFQGMSVEDIVAIYRNNKYFWQNKFENNTLLQKP